MMNRFYLRLKIILFVMLTIGYSAISCANVCDDLVVKFQNSTNKPMYVYYEIDEKVDSITVQPHHTDTLPRVVNKNGWDDTYVSIKVLSSLVKEKDLMQYVEKLSPSTSLDEGILPAGAITYNKIDKYYSYSDHNSNLVVAGAILLEDPQVYSNIISLETFLPGYKRALRHSASSLDYTVSYKNIFRGRCDIEPAKARPGTITIEVSPVI